MTTRTAPKPSPEAVAEFKGQVFELPVGDLSFLVRVRDVRNRFGHVDVLVDPLKGTGTQWVQADRLVGGPVSALRY